MHIFLTSVKRDKDKKMLMYLQILSCDNIVQTWACSLVLLMCQVLCEAPTQRRPFVPWLQRLIGVGQERHIAALLALLIDHMEINTLSSPRTVRNTHNKA